MPFVPDKYRGTKQYHIVLCLLIRSAQSRTSVSYKEIAKVLGINSPGNHMSREVGHILGEIAEDEHLAGRPLLTVVACGFHGVPGEGFYSIARQLGRLEGNAPADETAFWRTELSSIYEEWAETG